MEIVPPPIFKEAHRISARFTRYDPRLRSFPEVDLVVNLRNCTVVEPPAMLWCAVYLLLAKARGLDCLLITPFDRDAASPLEDAGLLHTLLQEGIDVEPNYFDEPHRPDAILPLTHFDSLSDAAELTNKVERSLINSRQGAPNIHPIVCETFAELANNAAEHSTSNIGAYGFVQFYSSGRGRRFGCGVADGGIGIRQSLERNPLLEHSGYEWSAIELATKELVSGTSCRTRGIGLFSVFDEMRAPGRELVIHSGKGILTMSGDSQIRMIRANLFPGTLVYVSVPA